MIACHHIQIDGSDAIDNVYTQVEDDLEGVMNATSQQGLMDSFRQLGKSIAELEQMAAKRQAVSTCSLWICINCLSLRLFFRDVCLWLFVLCLLSLSLPLSPSLSLSLSLSLLKTCLKKSLSIQYCFGPIM